jgi:pSer/pThr/pTyr-binding forkhead associated (FHA) protein
MELFLEIIDGPTPKGRFPIQAGFVIGRRDADISIRDSKISGRHAMIESRPLSGFWLIDQGSANGIKVDGAKVREVQLQLGLVLILGRTTLKVVNKSPQQAAPDPVPVVSAPDSWVEILKQLSKRVVSTDKILRMNIPFHHPVKLEIISGPQNGQTWVLGYGPRDVGPRSIDLTLEDKDLPAFCFRLIPEGERIRFEIHPDLERRIMINGSKKPGEYVEPGDVIEINTTKIQVSLMPTPQPRKDT